MSYQTRKVTVVVVVKTNGTKLAAVVKKETKQIKNISVRVGFEPGTSEQQLGALTTAPAQHRARMELELTVCVNRDT